MSEQIVSNTPKTDAMELTARPFTVYVTVNSAGGISIDADTGTDFYATLGAIEGARALLRCCVIDGYNRRKEPVGTATVATKEED